MYTNHMHFSDPSDSNFSAVQRALTEGVDFNNRGLEFFNQGKYEKAYKAYKKALEIKRAAYGDVSVHNCVTLSGLADSLLRLGRLDEAYTEARLMLDIAMQIGSDEQIRIAREVLKDVSVVRKVPLLPDEVMGALTTFSKVNYVPFFPFTFCTCKSL
ncbi:tetratricopeptide repeat protein [archaeon]|nr:MAG: tetratricopeptide repeat protein [archaeon]